MAKEIIQLVANGNIYTGWETVTVKAALKEAARSFELEISEVDSAGKLDAWHFPPGTPIEIRASGTQMLVGHVDDYEPELERAKHTVKIAGRSKGGDLADCSVDHPTCQLENKTLTQAANELSPDVPIVADPGVDDGSTIDTVRTGKGTSVHHEVKRLAQQRKAVMTGAADGSVHLTRAGKNRHSSGLYEGQQGFKKIHAKLSMRERFSEYQVVGQSADQWDDTQIKPKGKATDVAVPRKRVKVIVDQASTNPSLARNRAEWERDRAAGRSLTATVTTSNYRDSKGRLWEPGWIVFVKSKTARIEQDMIIESVTFSQSIHDGTTAAISLVDPRAYSGQAPAASGSDGMWDIG